MFIQIIPLLLQGGMCFCSRWIRHITWKCMYYKSLLHHSQDLAFWVTYGIFWSLYMNIVLIHRQELIIYTDIELIYNYSVLSWTTFFIAKWLQTKHHSCIGIRYVISYGWEKSSNKSNLGTKVILFKQLLLVPSSKIYLCVL